MSIPPYDISPKRGGKFDFKDGGTYIGEWCDGRAHGYGIATGPNNQGEYSGEWSVGFENCGVYVWPSGNMYEGLWMKGKRHGEGVQVMGRWIYKGNFTSGFTGRYGVKSSLYSQSRYEGCWHLNEFDGYGVETCSDGSTYAGMWFKSQRKGLGVSTSAQFGIAGDNRDSRDSRPTVNTSTNVAYGDNPETNAYHDSIVLCGEIKNGFVLIPATRPKIRAQEHFALLEKQNQLSSGKRKKSNKKETKTMKSELSSPSQLGSLSQDTRGYSSSSHFSNQSKNRDTLQQMSAPAEFERHSSRYLSLPRKLMQRLKISKRRPLLFRSSRSLSRTRTLEIEDVECTHSLTKPSRGSVKSNYSVDQPIDSSNTGNVSAMSDSSTIGIMSSTISSVIPGDDFLANIPREAVETYSGQWHANNRNGLGVAERSDGLKYIGEWYYNKRHGYGVTWLPRSYWQNYHHLHHSHNQFVVEEGRYKNNILVQQLNRKSRIFLIKHSRLKNMVDDVVQKALDVARDARIKANEIAYQRAQTARAAAISAQARADDARKMSKNAREIAKKISPEFEQPGILWELKRQKDQAASWSALALAKLQLLNSPIISNSMDCGESLPTQQHLQQQSQQQPQQQQQQQQQQALVNPVTQTKLYRPSNTPTRSRRHQTLFKSKSLVGSCSTAGASAETTSISDCISGFGPETNATNKQLTKPSTIYSSGKQHPIKWGLASSLDSPTSAQCMQHRCSPIDQSPIDRAPSSPSLFPVNISGAATSDNFSRPPVSSSSSSQPQPQQPQPQQSRAKPKLKSFRHLGARNNPNIKPTTQSSSAANLLASTCSSSTSAGSYYHDSGYYSIEPDSANAHLSSQYSTSINTSYIMTSFSQQQQQQQQQQPHHSSALSSELSSAPLSFFVSSASSPLHSLNLDYFDQYSTASITKPQLSHSISPQLSLSLYSTATTTASTSAGATSTSVRSALMSSVIPSTRPYPVSSYNPRHDRISLLTINRGSSLDETQLAGAAGMNSTGRSKRKMLRKNLSHDNSVDDSETGLIIEAISPPFPQSPSVDIEQQSLSFEKTNEAVGRVEHEADVIVHRMRTSSELMSETSQRSSLDHSIEDADPATELGDDSFRLKRHRLRSSKRRNPGLARSPPAFNHDDDSEVVNVTTIGAAQATGIGQSKAHKTFGSREIPLSVKEESSFEFPRVSSSSGDSSIVVQRVRQSESTEEDDEDQPTSTQKLAKTSTKATNLIKEDNLYQKLFHQPIPSDRGKVPVDITLYDLICLIMSAWAQYLMLKFRLTILPSLLDQIKMWLEDNITIVLVLLINFLVIFIFLHLFSNQTDNDD